MSKATQRARILAFCKEHGSITVRDVQTITETKDKPDGSTVRFNRYFIREVAANG